MSSKKPDKAALEPCGFGNSTAELLDEAAYELERVKQQLDYDARRLDWLNTITERKNWLKFWNDFMITDVRKAIDKAKDQEERTGGVNDHIEEEQQYSNYEGHEL